MSRIRADRIVNRAANGPVEASEGLIIPINKRISIGGNTGSPGQCLTTTSSGMAWSTVASSVSSLNDLSDLNINSPTSGQVIRYNGSQYINAFISYTDLTNKPVIPTIPTGIVTQNTSPTFNNLSISGNLVVTGTTTTTNLTTLNVTNNQIVLNDSTTGSPVANASVTVKRGTFPNTALRWNELDDRWEFTNNGTTYNKIPVENEYGDYDILINKPIIPRTLLELTDVIGNPLPNQILKWNGLSWTPSNESSAVDYSDLPIASPTVLGGVKIDGTSITVNSNGVISNTYTFQPIDVFGYSDRKILRLNNNSLTNQDIILIATGGISLTRASNILTFTGTTYSLSSETSVGNSVKLRLTGSDSSTDDIMFIGADGLTIERTDNQTITFRAPASGGGTVDSNTIKDTAALLLLNGSHTGISYTYDSNNKVINSIASAGGGGGTSVLYDLVGTNTTSNNAILQLIPSSGVTDQIEISGGGGTSVSWNGANSKISITSTAPVNADWNATSGLAQILNKPSIPTAYTLPTATGSVLGGVKVGANLSIDANGVLSANAGAYTLPKASDTILGGIKIGSGLTIDANGVVSAAVEGSLPVITDLSGTTSVLSAQTTAELNIVGYKAYVLYKITTSAEAWVRIYSDDISRDADSTRSEGNDPSPGSGVIAEIRTDGINNEQLITPGVLGFNDDNPRTSTIYLSVTNRSQAEQAITITVTALKIGD
jgi:hypothetical protein